MSVGILLIWMFLIPMAVGGIAAAGVDKRKKILPFMWIMGQFILWAVFQLICVPMILKQEMIKMVLEKEAFPVLVFLFQTIGVGLALIGVILLVWRSVIGKKRGLSKEEKKAAFRVVSNEKASGGRFYRALWAAFWLLLIFQLVMAVLYTYRDEDDAYYVATASIAVESNTMFWKLPYTGGATELDARHGLAPFSIWMAFLAKISGIPAVTVAHIFVPIMSIAMAYGIYYLIGSRLFRKGNRERLPLFLVFTELLILFGNYSRYTSENFLIARSRQGKAALGSLMVPVILYLMLEILERVQEKTKIGIMWWILLVSAVLTWCLCSTMGAVLICVLIGLVGVCTAVCYRRFLLLIPFALCCAPAVCYAMMYLILK